MSWEGWVTQGWLEIRLRLQALAVYWDHCVIPLCPLSSQLCLNGVISPAGTPGGHCHWEKPPDWEKAVVSLQRAWLLRTGHWALGILLPNHSAHPWLPLRVAGPMRKGLGQRDCLCAPQHPASQGPAQPPLPRDSDIGVVGTPRLFVPSWLSSPPGEALGPQCLLHGQLEGQGALPRTTWPQLQLQPQTQE